MNLGAAVAAAAAHRTPPEASIGSPQWYAPVTGSSRRHQGAGGRQAPHAATFSWRLEYGVGLAPRTWTAVRSGTSSTPVTDFGPLDLDAVRAALAARTTHEDRDDVAGPTFDPTRTDPYEGQFTVRLVVTSADGTALTGMDRKVLTALDDPTLRPGFPKRLAAGGEAPIRYADLDGDNHQELVVPTEDGRVHAYEPDGSELPGWPVHTETQYAAVRHLDSPALKAIAPPLRAAARADDRRPRRRRAPRGHHHRGRAHLRVGRRRARAARLARAPRPDAGQLRAVAAEQAAQAPQVRLPGRPGDRAPRRPLAAARRRRARPRRAPARLPARRPLGARLPGAARRPGRAAGRADDRRVDQPPGDRRPQRRRARRRRRAHQRGLRRLRRRRGRELRLRAQRRGHHLARVRRRRPRQRRPGGQAVPARLADRARRHHPGRPAAHRARPRPGAGEGRRHPAGRRVDHRRRALALRRRRARSRATSSSRAPAATAR